MSEKNILTIPHEGLFNRDFFYKTVEEIEPELLEKIRKKMGNYFFVRSYILCNLLSHILYYRKFYLWKDKTYLQEYSFVKIW